MDSSQLNPLLLASVKGDIEAVIQLISSNDVECVVSRDEDGRTPLMVAAMAGHLGVVNTLIPRMKQPDLSLQDKYGETALMYAAWEGHLHVVDALVPNLDSQGLLKKELNGNTALMCAAGNGKHEVMKALLPVFLKADPKALFQTEKLGRNALMLAAINGHFDVINEILSYPKQYYELKTQDALGETALMIAVKYKFHEGVKALLSLSTPTELKVKNILGHTSLMIAIFMRDLNLASILLPYFDGAALDVRDDENKAHALMYAVAYNLIDLVKILIPAYLKFDRRALNEVDGYGKTILMKAAEFGYVDIVNILLSYKAAGNSLDLNMVCRKNNENALMLAVYYGNVEIVNLLLPFYNSEDLKILNCFRQSALILAAMKNHPEVVRLLAPHYDSDGLNCKDDLFFTPFMHAVERGFIDVVNVLIPYLDTNALNEADDKGYTSLIWAALKGNLDMIKAFIDKLTVSQINKKSRDGSTALMIAALRGHYSVVELLLDYKADVTLEKNDGETALSFAITKLNKAQEVQAQAQDRDRDREKTKAKVKTYQNIAFRLLAAMTPTQLAEVKASRLGQNETVRKFETKLLNIQKEMYNTIMSMGDTRPFGSLEGLAGYMMQFYAHPLWYHHRMEKEVNAMLSKITALLEKRPKALSYTPAADNIVKTGTKRPRENSKEIISSAESNKCTSMRSSRSFERFF